MDVPAPSRMRRRLIWLVWLSVLNQMRALPSVYVDGNVFLAKVLPTVVLPSMAFVPACTVVPSTTKPPFVVHEERSPDSKPSWNTGTGADGVVTFTAVVSA